MANVEVFKTNVHKVRDAKRMLKVLSDMLPNCKINFDLDDCDRILRIETGSETLNPTRVIEALKTNGHTCVVL